MKTTLDALSKALDRLEEALRQPLENPLAVDATIQRFEFTIELFWKALKRCLQFEGIDTSTPRSALQQAYQAGWLQDESTWLQMLRDRNETSHTYDEGQAREIYDHGVDEQEVEDVLEGPGEDRPGRDGSRIAIGHTRAGRYLRVIYVPDPEPDSVFVITAYDLGGSPWSRIVGAGERRESDEADQVSPRLERSASSTRAGALRAAV